MKITLSKALLFLLAATFLTSAIAVKGQPQKHDSCTYRIMTYNIRNAKGMDGVTSYSRIAHVVHKYSPDVVALQEVDSLTQRSNGVYVLDKLAGLTKMYPTFSASIAFQGGKYGVGVLSKEKPLQYKSIALPGREEQRSALVVEFSTYVICCTHLSLTAEDRLAAVELIAKAVEGYSKPVILAGDLNATPDAQTLVELEKRWAILSNTNQPTFPSNEPTRCIDYIMVQPTGKVKLVKAETVTGVFASDHLPLYVDIKL